MRARVAGRRLGEPGVDEAERDRVDGDVVAAPLLGQGLGQADHAGLGRGVVGLPGVAAQAGDGGDVDDLAAGYAVPCGRSSLAPEMTGWAARRIRNGAFRCTSRMASHCSSVIFWMTESQV